MDYLLFYDLVIEEQERLRQLDVADDYRLCFALTACYLMQDYLANRIAEEGLEEY